MIPYRKFRPTDFDAAGLGLPDRQDWLVLEVFQNRDSGILEQSNFHSALDILCEKDDETVEVHRFRHWGPGWFEIILIHPSREKDGEDIERSLENYLILDEEDFSQREYDVAYEYWERRGMKERIRICTKFRESIFAARRDIIPERVEISYLAK